MKEAKLTLGKGKEKGSVEHCFSTWALRALCSEKANESKYLNRREKCPDDIDLLENPTISLFNKWLPAFVVEARREDGKMIPRCYDLPTSCWTLASCAYNLSRTAYKGG